MDNKKLGIILGAVLVVALASLGIFLAIHFTSKTDQQADERDGACCQKLLISGTTNKDAFYQSMMGTYARNEGFPNLVYSDSTPHPGTYPTYNHTFLIGELEKTAYLYFYQNLEPKKEEKECPNGCWIISMYDLLPNNYWFGRKWYYLPMDTPPMCPDHLTDDGRQFTNQDSKKDTGLKIVCAE